MTNNTLDKEQLEIVTGGTYAELYEMKELINDLHIGFQVSSHYGLRNCLKSIPVSASRDSTIQMPTTTLSCSKTAGRSATKR